MPETPELVRLDPWLEPYTAEIQRRISRFETWEKELQSDPSITRWHEKVGLFYNKKEKSWTLREWAPAAQSLSLIADFNAWDRSATPLMKSSDGFWEVTVPSKALKHKDIYKLHVVGANGAATDRIPSTAQRTVQDEETNDFAAQVWKPRGKYKWQNTFTSPTDSSPIIYEAHVGMSGEEERVHTYREFADEVIPRIAKGNYNTIQLMAVAEHPYYGSFGYHVSNFFAPTSRFGTPDDLKYLIDTAHGHGLVVLMDIVHSHSVKNTAEGLNDFDGSASQYFRAEHPQWDSMVFDYGKHEVRSFLLSNVRYWLEEFHFDGFRFDGITSMLYYHFGLGSFDHYDKYFKDGVDEEAILYLQLANSLIKEITPEGLIIAEDMSGMPGLCRPISEGGLGFSHRLAMGIPDYWIKLLKHQKDEEWDLEATFNVLNNRRFGEASISYVESHDQALVGDKTTAFWLMDKDMYFDMSIESKNPVIDRGIALHKMIRLITAAAGGEGYLTFIGNEFGHPEWVDFPREGNEWSYKHCRRLWSLPDNKKLRYKHLQNFDQALTKFLETSKVLPALPAKMIHHHGTDRVIAFERNNHIFIFNFSADQAFTDYGIPVEGEKDYKVALSTDQKKFGGFTRIDTKIDYPVSEGRIHLYLPPRTAIVLRPKKGGA